jgi:16S rRNA C1402 (ribose-2'-O) methylase RsmI
LYEENFRGKIGDVINHFNNKAIKGEIVIVVDGNKNSQQTDVNEEEL